MVYIASKNPHLLQHLDLQCQGNHPRGKCERGEAAHTSRYTQPFARKVIDSLAEGEPWHRILEAQVAADCSGKLLEEAQVGSSEVETLEISDEERRNIERKIQHIHQNTGHSSMKHLVQVLEKRGVHPKVLQVAKQWQCNICLHRKRMDPRRFVRLEVAPQKWERVQMDVATWVHPQSKIKYHILVLIDEGSRFRVTRVLTTGPGNPVTWAMMQRCLEENWLSIFGCPRMLRTDAAGPCNSDEADLYLAERGIEFVNIPAEAHWQVGIVEGAIKSLKGMLEKLAETFPEANTPELLARSTWVCNTEELYRGFSPLQQALGRGPDTHGHIFDDDTIKPIGPDLLEDGGFSEDVKMRCAASKAFAEEQAKRKLERAARMGHRNQQDFLPGDLVYYWRRQVPLKDKTSQGAGRFIGPARVIATETRKTTEGEWRPGSIVWLHRGGRLLKASPEQLRKASPFEIQVESLKGPVELPWTITSLATDSKRRTFIDVSVEVPSVQQWEAAHEHEPKRSHPGELVYQTTELARKALHHRKVQNEMLNKHNYLMKMNLNKALVQAAVHTNVQKKTCFMHMRKT